MYGALNQQPIGNTYVINKYGQQLGACKHLCYLLSGRQKKKLEKAQVYEFIHYVLALALQLMRV